jgi:hypothetical protein
MHVNLYKFLYVRAEKYNNYAEYLSRRRMKFNCPNEQAPRYFASLIQLNIIASVSKFVYCFQAFKQTFLHISQFP